MLQKMLLMTGFAAMMFGATQITLAQNGNGDVDESDDEIVDVTAYVSVPLRITKLSDLDLGTVRRNESRTVAATDAGAAVLMVTGDAEEDIQFTYPAAPSTVTLNHTDDDDGATLQVTLNARTSSTQNGTTTGYVSGSSVELSSDGGGDGTMDSDGQRYFHIGGTVNASNSQPRGSYNGSFDVSADYYP
jgi:hypothetical protein